MGFDVTLLETKAPRKRSDDSHHGVVRLHAAEITRAREDGATWRSIAAALGLRISPDAVRQYYLAAIGQSTRRKGKGKGKSSEAGQHVAQESVATRAVPSTPATASVQPSSALAAIRAKRAEKGTSELPALTPPSANSGQESDPLDPHGIYSGGDVSMDRLLAAITPPPKSLP